MDTRVAGIAAPLFLGLLAVGVAPTAALPRSACPDPAALTRGMSGPLAHVRYLADDALEGRDSGSEGERCAARYLVDRFEEIGLEPAGEEGSWFQPFPVRTGAEVTGAVLEIDGSASREGAVWTPHEGGWTPFGFSASESVEAPLAYDGEGVAHPGSGERRPPVDGRIVVLEAATTGARGIYSDPHFKASVAAGRGAVGAILLLPEDEPLPDVSSEVRPRVDIPVAAVRGAAAERVRELARAGATATLSTGVRPVVSEARNVVALLPGSDPALRHELVVLGAHYDHLGLGGRGSLAPDTRAVHNGADDNASGTAALVEAARLLAHGEPLERSVLFVAFTGEEKGLLGSGRFVEDPTVPLEGALAMINMDMVGRLRDNTLTVYGLGTAEEWDAVLEAANRAAAERAGTEPMVLSKLPDGFGPSDHSSFYARGIPVLHFFTNTHSVYHRPEDDWETVDADGIGRVARLAVETARRLAGTPGRTAVALTPLAGAGSPHGTPGTPGSPDDEAPSPGGYGPYLGTIPDMTPLDSGVRLTGVREGSPAERAGLRGGDVIVEFAGREIGDLYAFTYALRDHAPGDEVEVVVERDGRRVTLTAVLGERR